MKHIYLFLLLLSNSVFAQFTLTSNYSFQGGTGFRSYELNHTATTTAGGAGANQAWNYSGLSTNPHYDNTVVDTMPATYGSTNVAYRTNHSPARYYFYQKGADSLVNWGYLNTDIGSITYTDPQKFLQYPMSFGDPSFGDSLKGSGQLAGFGITIPANRKGASVTQVDGWGSLALPNTSYPSVVRVKSVITMQDDFNNGFIIGNAVSNITLYNFYAQNISYPVFTMAFSTVNVTSNFINSTESDTVLVENTSIPTGITSAPYDVAGLSLYPNPASDLLNVDFNMNTSGEVKISVKDMTGREVKVLDNKTFPAGANNAVYSLSGIEAGAYMVEIDAEGRKGFRKLVVK